MSWCHDTHSVKYSDLKYPPSMNVQHMYPRVTNTSIKIYVCSNIPEVSIMPLPITAPPPSGNPYSDLYHHRLTLPCEIHIYEIVQNIFSCVAFLSFIIMSMRFITLSTRLCLCIVETHSMIWRYHNLCIYSTNDWRWVLPVFSHYECSHYTHSHTDILLDTHPLTSLG